MGPESGALGGFLQKTYPQLIAIDPSLSVDEGDQLRLESEGGAFIGFFGLSSLLPNNASANSYFLRSDYLAAAFPSIFAAKTPFFQIFSIENTTPESTLARHTNHLTFFLGTPLSRMDFVRKHFDEFTADLFLKSKHFHSLEDVVFMTDELYHLTDPAFLKTRVLGKKQGEPPHYQSAQGNAINPYTYSFGSVDFVNCALTFHEAITDMQESVAPTLIGQFYKYFTKKNPRLISQKMPSYLENYILPGKSIPDAGER